MSDCQHECKEPPPPGEICPVGKLKYSSSDLFSNKFSSKISFSSITTTNIYEQTTSATSTCCPDNIWSYSGCGYYGCSQNTRFRQCFTNPSCTECVYDYNCDSNYTTTTTISGGGNTSTTTDECFCRYELRLAASYVFKCTDNKYFVPSDKGPVPLTFIAFAIASKRDPCRGCGPCPCPGCGC